MFYPVYWALLSLAAFSFYWVLRSAWLSLAIEKWNKFDQAYSHGYIVLALFIYLFIRAFRTIDFTRIKPCYWVIPFQLGASLLFILSVHAGILIFQWSLLPILILMFFVLLFGFNESSKLWFPILFLYFSIPIWGYLIEWLQSLTVVVNTHLLALINIPAYIEAYYVTIPEGTFEVAGGCSGLNFFIVIFSLSSLYGYLNYSTYRTKLILVGVGLLMGLISNWIRVFVIIYMGHITNMKSYLIVEDHSTFGWVLFAVMLIPFFYLAHKLPVWLNDQYVEVHYPDNSGLNVFKLKPLMVSFLCTFLFPLVIHPVASNHTLGLLPSFTGAMIEHQLWFKPDYHGADVSEDRMIVLNGSVIQVSTRIYESQQQGSKELISYNNAMYPNYWKVVGSSKVEGFKFNVIDDSRSESMFLSAFQYSIGGVRVTDSIQAKLLELFKPIMTLQRSSLLLIGTACEDESCDSEKQQILNFIHLNNETIKSL